MKFQKKQKPFKKCPRCGNKCLANQEKCEECELVFAKLQYASNAAAKKKLAHFDRDYVIYTNDLPKDVSKVKLWLYFVLLGWIGGHYYYVGKYIKGLLMSFGFVYLVLGTIFNSYIVAADATLLYIPISIYALSWIVSFSYLLWKKFKVPIFFDENLLQAEKENTRMEYDRIHEQIKDENEKLNKKKNEKADKKEVQNKNGDVKNIEKSKKQKSEKETKDEHENMKKKTKTGDKK